MMKSKVTREEALELLKTYNKEPFHIQHGMTVEKVMRWCSTARRRRNFSEKEEWVRT